MCGSIKTAFFAAFAMMILISCIQPATGDATPPSITSMTPLDNATGVARTQGQIEITFDRPVVIESGAITINATTGPVLFENIQTSAMSGTTTVIATLSGLFDYSTDYHVLIPNTLFRDAANNFFPGISDPTVWNFRTVSP